VRERAPLVVVGDALLDRDVVGTVERLCPDAPVPVVDQQHARSRPGGAGLAALLAAADGRTVVLVTALGRDAAGAELAALLDDHGVAVLDLGLGGATPEKVRIGAPGRPLVRLDRGAASAVGAPGAAARTAIASARAVLVSDYGRGVAASPAVREAVAAARGSVVWDPHPRGAAPVPGVALATPNLAEASAFAGPPGDTAPAVAARELVRRWRAEAVCVTCGARGAVLAQRDRPTLTVPAEPAAGGDACGAGDRFASRAAAALADGASAAEAARDAVGAASRFVAAGGASSVAARTAPRAPAPPRGEAIAVARSVRAAGGTVVAAGGCFDVLHPGHVRTLEAARALGDCLVVCLNSDASVARLKGPSRPVVGADDRAAVLRALRCVDAVLVFDEDTPAAALERLRPDVWAKGGDYAGVELPEAAVLARWGGEVVVLPFVAGQSSTRIIAEVALHAV
jgi:D-beta-D-heptose 7-phosphate kinase/D-beta-D-heptose 1-phosphate adenosyltransferase